MVIAMMKFTIFYEHACGCYVVVYSFRLPLSCLSFETKLTEVEFILSRASGRPKRNFSGVGWLDMEAGAA